MNQEQATNQYEAMKHTGDAVAVDATQNYFRMARRQRRALAHGQRKLANQRKATKGRVRQYVALGCGIYKLILHKRK